MTSAAEVGGQSPWRQEQVRLGTPFSLQPPLALVIFSVCLPQSGAAPCLGGAEQGSPGEAAGLAGHTAEPRSAGDETSRPTSHTNAPLWHRGYWEWRNLGPGVPFPSAWNWLCYKAHNL